MVDPGRIVQVLNNLFSNASRHAPESSPIRVAAARDGLHVAISVTDHGRGRAAGPAAAPVPQACRGGHRGRGRAGSEARAWVWPYAKDSWRRTEAASGPRATEQGRGHPVHVHRAGGRRRRATPPAPLRAAPRQPRKSEERTCVLVVDDDPQTLRYVRDALTEADYAPVVTGDPEELPGLIKTHKPRLVLMDLVLPGTDGIELMTDMGELADSCRSSSSRPTAGTRPSSGRWTRALPTTSSSPSSPSELDVLECGRPCGAEGRAGTLPARGAGDSLQGTTRHRGWPSRDLDGDRSSRCSAYSRPTLAGP